MRGLRFRHHRRFVLSAHSVLLWRPSCTHTKKAPTFLIIRWPHGGCLLAFDHRLVYGARLGESISGSNR